jgi:hypothetical protein
MLSEHAALHDIRTLRVLHFPCQQAEMFSADLGSRSGGLGLTEGRWQKRRRWRTSGLISRHLEMTVNQDFKSGLRSRSMKSASANPELVDQDSGVPLERKSQVTALSSVLKFMAFILGTNQPRLKFAIRLFEPWLPMGMPGIPQLQKMFSNVMKELHCNKHI